MSDEPPQISILDARLAEIDRRLRSIQTELVAEEEEDAPVQPAVAGPGVESAVAAPGVESAVAGPGLDSDSAIAVPPPAGPVSALPADRALREPAPADPDRAELPPRAEVPEPEAESQRRLEVPEPRAAPPRVEVPEPPRVAVPEPGPVPPPRRQVPGPEAAGSEAPASELAALGAELRRIAQAQESLVASMRELVSAYEAAVAGLAQGDPSSALPQLGVSAGPFPSTEALRGFERALSQIPDVREVEVRGFEGGDRAIVYVHLHDSTP